jgi:adenine-specific DNA methylase
MSKRLIEQRLPLEKVSIESAREKSIRHGHISTLHIWWVPRRRSRLVASDRGDPLR